MEVCVFEKLCTREEIEKMLDIRIRNLSLYQEALLHKSAVKLYDAPKSNERLEFIGDSVLNLIIARLLYDKYPSENEGFMTKLRTRIVSGQCLSEIARLMELHNHVRMNEKALKQGWNKNNRILEDVFEAIIGAVYLDLGLEMATTYVQSKLTKYVDFNDVLKDSNYKDILMRYTQNSNLKLPLYAVTNENGPNHNKQFIVNVYINENGIGEGIAKNKKQAEQLAAKNALQCMGIV